MTHRHPHPQRRQPPARRHLLAALLATGALAFGCEDPSTETLPPPCVVSETLRIDSLVLELEGEAGVLRGVDLDGHESTDDDPEGCFEDDWEDLDGSWVDNQFAILGPTLEYAFDTDPRFLFADNQLTLAVESRGEGEVCTGVEVALEDGDWRAAEWNGSTLRVYDLGDVPLRFTLPGVSVIVTLRDAAARMTLTAEDRIATVVLSGAIDAEEITEVIAEALPDVDEDLLRSVFRDIADIDGERTDCSRISVSFEAQPEAPRP